VWYVLQRYLAAVVTSSQPHVSTGKRLTHQVQTALHGPRNVLILTIDQTHTALRPQPLHSESGQRPVVIRKNYGNDILPEANYTALGRRYFLRKYLQVDKL